MYLSFKSMQYFMKHILQIGPWILPRCYGIAKENEVIDNTGRVDAYHLTHATECWVLFIIIPDIAQACTPGPDKLSKRWGNLKIIQKLTFFKIIHKLVFTSLGQTYPILPIVIAVFSSKVLGVLGRLMIIIKGCNNMGT